MLPFVRDYNPYTTKYAGYKQVADYYPLSVYVGVVSKSGSEVRNVIDPSTGKRKAPPRVPKPSVEHKEIQDAKAVAKIYWKIVLEHADEILKMTDEELYAKLETKGYEYKYKDHTYMPKKFEWFGHAYREPLARTRWNGWCVPSALAGLIWVVNDQWYKGYLPRVDESSFLTKNYREKNGNTGYYDFNWSNDTKKDRIKARSAIADNGLYYDLVKSFNLKSDWDGAVNIHTGAIGVVKVTNNKIGYVALGPDGLNMHNHIKNRKGPVIDGIRTSKKGGHARLLVGTKYYWYEHWNWWYTYYWYIKRWYLKWGWLWTAEWAQGSNYWETSVLSGEWGTKFLVWDNGSDTKPYGYVPYWENSTAVSRTDAIGFTY